MDVNRRDFLKIGLMTAAATTFSACGRPVEHGIVSQYQMPEYTVLGRPIFWATTCTDLRADCAVSVKAVENRAIQVVGLPGHFFSKGFANKEAISGLQVQYNPARIKASVGVSEGESAAAVVAAEAKKAGGKTLFVVDRVHGTSGHAIVQAAQAVGGKIWVCDREQSVRERRILKAVTGRAELPFYDLEQRDFVLSVGSNFVADNYSRPRTEWAYGKFRQTPGRLRGRMASASVRMNPTDVCADRWFPLNPGTEATFLAAVGTVVASKGKGGWPGWAKVSVEDGASITGVEPEVFEKLGERLVESDAPLVVGGFQGANGDATVFLAHTLTKMLNGDVATFDPDTLVGSGSASGDLFLNDKDAATALAGADVVVIHDVDLVYRFPWLTESFKKVKSRVVLASMPSETTPEATRLIPLKTWMEDWGDLRVTSPDGEWYGLAQPAVRSWVAAAVSTLGFYLEFAKEAGASIAEISPRLTLQGSNDKKAWEAMLVRGGVWKEEPDSVYPHRASDPPPVAPNSGSVPSGYSAFASLSPLTVSSLPASPSGAEMVFIPLSTHLADGAMASRPWMQELPDAMTTVVWDSWVEINDDFAKANGIERHDLVEVTTPSGKIVGSAYPSPFIHKNAVGIPTGRGQKQPILKEFIEIGWESDGSNPKDLLDGTPGSSGYYQMVAAGASVSKKEGSKLLATFDKRVYNLPRHILPE